MLQCSNRLRSSRLVKLLQLLGPLAVPTPLWGARRPLAPRNLSGQDLPPQGLEGEHHPPTSSLLLLPEHPHFTNKHCNKVVLAVLQLPLHIPRLGHALQLPPQTHLHSCTAALLSKAARRERETTKPVAKIRTYVREKVCQKAN